MRLILFIGVWLIGYLLAFVMQRTEIAAEKQTYTVGDRLFIYTLSLLSFLWIIVILVSNWIKYINSTGYWNNPVQKEVKEEKLITTTKKQLN